VFHIAISATSCSAERIRRLRPDLAIDRAFPAGGFVRQESNTALGRRTWPYSASDNTKWVVASCPRMVSSNASVDFIDFPVRHVSVSPHLQRLRLAQALANGGGLDYYVIGRLDGKQIGPASKASMTFRSTATRDVY
jgi:hypothetical protein